jgi:hypothetical protein
MRIGPKAQGGIRRMSDAALTAPDADRCDRFRGPLLVRRR